MASSIWINNSVRKHSQALEPHNLYFSIVRAISCMVWTQSKQHSPKTSLGHRYKVTASRDFPPIGSLAIGTYSEGWESLIRKWVIPCQLGWEPEGGHGIYKITSCPVSAWQVSWSWIHRRIMANRAGKELKRSSWVHFLWHTLLSLYRFYTAAADEGSGENTPWSWTSGVKTWANRLTSTVVQNL